eukprot:snap_masked-scaffold_2-processed-gene-11.4-mRNA-1 protein AED:0.14 eAED:0.14 QI:0/-1/0/1/-1/1/1/0/1364
MSFRQYELLEYIRVLRWGRRGSSLRIRRYYLFGKNIDQSKVVRQKHKNVLLVKGGLPEELDRVIQMLSLLQGGSVNVFPKIKVRKDGQPLRKERKTMVGVSQLITDEQHSLINYLQRDALAGDSKWLSCYHEHVVVGDSFAHYLAEVRQAVDAQRLGLTRVEVPGMLWVRNTATSVDLVERINTGDTSGIDFGEVIRLKRHVEDIADDDLGDILLPDVDEEVDPVSEEIEIKEAISSMISKATDASMEMKKKLKALCLEYWDVFATDHSQTRISKLEPMPVFPLENYEFKYPRARPTSAEKSRFIKEKIMSMEKRKLLKLVPAAEFGSVVFAVPKKGNKLRMVVDLVDVNKILRRDVNQLPFLEKSFENLAESKFYASFDVVSGFDQLGITEEAKKYFNIVSEHGTYQLNFAPMGYHSTPVFFHQQMVKHVVGREVEGRHGHGIIQWIDDSLIYADNFDNFIKVLKSFFENLKKVKVRISPQKSTIFSIRISYCGREVEGGKWNFDKEYYEKILEVPRPEFVYQLAAILHLAQWLSLAIPKLGELRGKVMAKYPQMKGEKSDLKRKNEHIEWSEELSDDFEEFKRILSIAAKQKLQTYDRDQDLVLVTDASKEYHSAIVFQAGSSERSKSLLKKTMFPMMFFSGKFAEDQQRWGIVHKELYPIVKTFSRLSYLLPYHPTPIQVYTDHMNLRAIIKGGSRINHGHLNRLQRWVLTLQQAQVELYHVDGESDIFADMLSRWAARVERKDQEIKAARALVRDPPPESLDTGERNFYRKMFVSPTNQELEQLREMVPEAPDDIEVKSMLDQDSFDTWYLDDDVKYGTRQDGGLTFVREPIKKVGEEFLLRNVDESAVTFDEILDWATEQAEYEDSSGPTIEDLGTASEDDEVLRVTVNAVRLNPNKQREKRTYEQMRAFDKDRVSAFNPYYEGTWKRISEAELLDSQKAERLGDGIKLARAGDKVVIPEILFERQMVHIHLAGHHGPVSACVAEASKYAWVIPETYGEGATLRSIFQDLKVNCAHCRKGPSLLKTALSIVTEARAPREVLVSDYLYVNPKGYILVLTDAFSRFTYLKYAPKANAETVVAALEDFNSNWKLESNFTLVTDRGSHFANQVLEKLSKALGFTHNFAVSYASWTNGEIEVVHKKVLDFLKALVSERRYQWDEWPLVLGTVQAAMNELPIMSRKLPGECKAPCANQLFLFINPEKDYIEAAAFPRLISRKVGGEVKVIDTERDTLFKLSKKFRDQLDEYHGRVADYVSLMKSKRNAYWNKRRKRFDKALLQYQVGEWCLISTAKTPRETNKIKLEWSGPVLIQEVLSNNVYRVRLLNGMTLTVHASRLYFYEPSGYVPDDALRKIFVNNWGGA